MLDHIVKTLLNRMLNLLAALAPFVLLSLDPTP